ncbi:membrane protease YdiL (CAAX protease family) [Metabacillus crassostreae]|uniref:DUF4181 domain-containing protein n=1 Tax=Metabacillus crassostreae TaxID=929098 RepID=UPI001959608E|nr:DUF4181 domain-containing protein [Metabacillus crassostreae]MBM7602564.1 membrane protease YdiL (CAAX protease family) [Metabacillus crassostreae]
MNLVLLLLILVLIIFVTEKLTYKILGVQKKNIDDIRGENIDRWGRGIILVIFLCTLWFVSNKDSDNIMKLFWMAYFTLLFGFQAVMEFIFIKDSKQYMGTAIILILGLIIIYNLDYLFSIIN